MLAWRNVAISIGSLFFHVHLIVKKCRFVQICKQHRAGMYDSTFTFEGRLTHRNLV